MNSKGQSLVDFDPAEPAPSRRSLLGTAGLAGLIGTAAAVLGSTSAAAAPEPAPAPNRPTDSDREALRGALSVELAAAQLYELAAAELPDDFAPIAAIMAEQHEAYADSISGVIGATSSDMARASIASELAADFTTSDPQAFGAAARQLENVAVATHTELVGAYDSVDAIELTASILTVESRHAAVLTSLAGYSSNLDEMLGNSADALTFAGGAS